MEWVIITSDSFTAEELIKIALILNIKCEKCGKEIKLGETYYTAIGVVQCDECNTKDNGTVSLDFIFDKNKKQKSDK